MDSANPPETPPTHGPADAPSALRLLGSSAQAIRYQFAAQLLIGFLLDREYHPIVAKAHADVAAMHADGLSRLLQAMHYWGSAILILHGLCHLAAGVWLGGYRRPYAPRFIESTLELFVAIGFQMTGNLLPFDRHGVQTAAIESSIVARAPIVGASASHLVLGGNAVGPATLAIWFRLHSLGLVVLLLAVLLVGFMGRRRSAYADANGWLPWLWVPLLVAISIGIPSPIGSPATPVDYNSFDAHTSWYVWPLHGALRMFDAWIPGGGWIGAFVLPGLLMVFLLSLPWWGPRVRTMWVRGAALGFAGIFLAGTALYGGSFAPLTGTRDPQSGSDPANANAGSGGAATQPIDKALAARGRIDFNTLTCSGCHGADGATGGGGPVLTTEWRKHPDSSFYVRYIKNPVAVQPESTMPAFPQLNDGQLNELAEYLRSPK
jgi:quinol-cytochrome oxidoreductase complex cytochrome b subunit